MELNKIWNESNEITLKEHLDNNSIDIVLTSPFYNLKDSRTREIGGKCNQVGKYDEFVDSMTDEEYEKYILGLFEGFNRVLKPNGVVLWNVSYCATDPSSMFHCITRIFTESNFTIGDVITWKKQSALPFGSPNRLTRITEYIFVFARKSEINTYKCYGKKSVGFGTGDNAKKEYYTTLYNFIEAKNNDESCELNKATYSTDLCRKLLNIYGQEGITVYDPFMGTGTTALACKQLGMNYVGSELSAKQCEWAENRLLIGRGSLDKPHDINMLF